ncbi:MAG: ribosome recycling factor [Thermomicrobiales bacterium]
MILSGLWYPPEVLDRHPNNEIVTIRVLTFINYREVPHMIEDILLDAELRMGKAMESLDHNLASVRTGRASPKLLDRLHVDYYGASTPLNQLAGVSAPEARLLVIQPWDKGSIGPIEKAILSSDLGMNPSNDGQVIRLNIPSLTEERRKQMVKTVHSTVEEAKVSVRNVRRDAMSQSRELLNKKEISEDDERRSHSEMDALTKRFTDEADKIGKAKEAEVLEV